MSLIVQIKSLIISLFLGLIISFLYSLINRLTYRFKNTVIRYVIEIMMMAFFSFCYVLINVYVNDGLINFYMILFLIAGAILYERFYAIYLLYLFEGLMCIIKIIFSPVLFIFDLIYGILKKVKRRVKKWRRKKEKLTMEKSEV
ncbi:MAG: spore cortex biosynthesis protein YabQ [Beduini sp.]